MIGVCKNCHFWDYAAIVYNPRHDDPDEGICRRNPPAVVLDYSYVHKIYSGDAEFALSPAYCTKYPTLGKDEWCGEFKKRDCL